MDQKEKNRTKRAVLMKKKKQQVMRRRVILAGALILLIVLAAVLVRSCKKTQTASGGGTESDQTAAQGQDATTAEQNAGDSQVIIVLDAGHDNQHAGAEANGLKESELTLKIAKYCKAELEQYKGVKVYMTRETMDCPYPGGDSKSDNKSRAEFAGSVHADFFVSLHLNSSPTADTSGAEVIYPNENYVAEYNTSGKAMAEDILNRLTALGLGKLGTGLTTRTSTESSDADEDWYPDGSHADYYNVIRNAKRSGVPAVIVEHGFLTSTTDVASFFSSEEKLQQVGAADAAGIADYFHLSK